MEGIHLSVENLPEFVQQIGLVLKAFRDISSGTEPGLILDTVHGGFIKDAAQWNQTVCSIFRIDLDLWEQILRILPIIFKKIRIPKEIFSQIIEVIGLLLVEQQFFSPMNEYFVNYNAAMLLYWICLPSAILNVKFDSSVFAAAKTKNVDKLLFANHTDFNPEKDYMNPGNQLILTDYDDSRNPLKAAKKYILDATWKTSSYRNDGIPTVYRYPIISICQRNGTGKTRLMIELGRKIFPSVYMNLDRYTGSPSNLRKFIEDLATEDKHIPRKEKVAEAGALILAILDYVHGKLKKSELYSFPEPVENIYFYPELLHSIMVPFLPSTQKSNPNKSSSTWGQILETARKKADSLLENWKRGQYMGTKNFPLVIISIDEAAALLNCPERNISPFHIIRQAAHELVEMRPKDERAFMLLFADAKIEIANFPPNIKDDPSLYGVKEIGDLYPPFFFIPTHDIKAREYLDTARKACARDVLGRQNWFKFLNKRDKDKDNFGMNKLGSPRWDELSKSQEWGSLFAYASLKLSRSGDKFAAIASRIPLKISPTSDIASNMVSQCMAHIDWVSEDRERLHISYPSDPVLATGGACCTNGLGHEVLQDLYKKILDCDVVVYNIGELVGQILLLCAIDRCQLLSLRSTTVLTFLTTLFPSISNLQGEFFSESDLAKAKLFFNHFIPVGDEVGRKLLCMALIRGAAISGKSNQDSIDVFIPICLPDARLSCIVIQFNNDPYSFDHETASTLLNGMDAYAVKVFGNVPAVKILFNFGRGQVTPMQRADIRSRGVCIFSQGLQLSGHKYWDQAQESHDVLQNILKISLGLVRAVAERDLPPFLREIFQSDMQF